MAKPIRAVSFDYDGSLGHSGVTVQNVLTKNKVFLDSIRAKKDAYAKTITFVGSNRQDYSTDNHNAGINNNGSCFAAIQAASTYIGATFDRLLLADFNAHKPSGSTCNEIMAGQQPSVNYDFDHGKNGLLYAQMQKMANDNPHDNIIFDFYDDNPEILGSLRDFFQAFPHLIPENVTLNLNQYPGPNGFCIDIDGHIHGQWTSQVMEDSQVSIKGEGRINQNYSDAVLAMGRAPAVGNPPDRTAAIKEAIENRNPEYSALFSEEQLKATATTEVPQQIVSSAQEVTAKFKQATQEVRHGKVRQGTGAILAKRHQNATEALATARHKHQRAETEAPHLLDKYALQITEASNTLNSVVDEMGHPEKYMDDDELNEAVKQARSDVEKSKTEKGKLGWMSGSTKKEAAETKLLRCQKTLMRVQNEQDMRTSSNESHSGHKP